VRRVTQPAPQPVLPEEVESLAMGVMRADRFPVLATLDGDQPRARPVSPVRTDGFTVYVANLRRYHKTEEIAAQPNVELCYVSDAHDQVRLTGRAEIVTDATLLDAIWQENPLLRHYLGRPDHPELVVYAIVPLRIRFMREWAMEYHEVPFARGDVARGRA
jgi:general stress protein 26